MNFSISSSNPRRFVIAVLVLLALLFALTLLARQVLVATGDFLPEEEIVRIQQAAGKPCIFSEYGKQNEGFFKFQVYRTVKPDIAVLGSSRVLELTQRQFSRPFVNLGRMMTDIKRGESAVAELLAVHKPKFMLIGLDQYWFNPNWDEAGVDKVKLIRSDPNDPRAILRLMGIIWREGMWHEAWTALRNGPDCPLGVSAMRYHSGYAPDGYRYYGELLTATKPAEDRHLRMTLGRIENGTRRFEKSATISQSQFDYLMKMHRRLESEGVPHVFFFPHFAPTVTAAMEKDGGYGYIQELERALAASGLPYVPTTDPLLQDCDFIDGFHMGDAASIRQIKAVAEADPRVAPYLNMNEVNRLSTPGALPVTYLTEDLGLPPRDYLDLGCTWAKTP